ncbi:MAG: LCP family protein, partial [Nocardioides sp.]
MKRMMRWLGLGLALALLGLAVPDSTVAPTEVVLVKNQRAFGIDAGKKVIWILAVGSDARPGEDMTRVRGDALQLVGINTATGAATAIGVPRDSWVSIPGVGSQRINAALYYGGPQLMGEAVGNLVGIQPDYVMVTRFEFFSRMIGYVGGIRVNNPRAFSDTYLKPKGFEEGDIHLGPYDALVFSRIRKTLLRGDFDRSANQQLTLRGIQAKVRMRAAQPGFLEGGVLTVLKNTSTDLPPADLFRIAQAVAQVDPAKITSCVVQGSIGNIGGASVVLPYTEMAASYGEQARDDATIEDCGY